MALLTYDIEDGVLYVMVVSSTFTIDLLSGYLDGIITEIPLEEAETITEIQIVRK